VVPAGGRPADRGQERQGQADDLPGLVGAGGRAVGVDVPVLVPAEPGGPEGDGDRGQRDGREQAVLQQSSVRTRIRTRAHVHAHGSRVSDLRGGDQGADTQFRYSGPLIGPVNPDPPLGFRCRAESRRPVPVPPLVGTGTGRCGPEGSRAFMESDGPPQGSCGSPWQARDPYRSRRIHTVSRGSLHLSGSIPFRRAHRASVFGGWWIAWKSAETVRRHALPFRALGWWPVWATSGCCAAGSGSCQLTIRSRRFRCRTDGFFAGQPYKVSFPVRMFKRAESKGWRP
jgi:hypothetical protein